MRDDLVHRGRMAGKGLVRLGHELAHRLLRADYAAARMVKVMVERDCARLPRPDPIAPVGASLRLLADLQATRHSGEPGTHDGIVVEGRRLRLVRVGAADLGPNVRMRAKLVHYPPTTTYSVA